MNEPKKEERAKKDKEIREYLKGRVLIPAIKSIINKKGKKVKQTFRADNPLRQALRQEAKDRGMSRKQLKKYMKKNNIKMSI